MKFINYNFIEAIVYLESVELLGVVVLGRERDGGVVQHEIARR